VLGSMIRRFFIFVLVILLASKDLLESIANSISSTIDMTSVSFSEMQSYSLWHSYAGSSRSYRPTGVKILNQQMTDKEYVKSRIHMAGTILFGPEKASSILYSVTPRDNLFLPEERLCIHSMMTLFAKHCGFRGQYQYKHLRPFKNLCNHVVDRTEIEGAFIVSCGSKHIDANGNTNCSLISSFETAVVNVSSPSLEVTPTPLDGSSEYCERIFVNGVSRLKLGSFARIYSGLLIVTEAFSFGWHDRAQICFHKNAALGMCQCKKEDWRPFKHGVLNFVLSPYEDRIIDIKFNSTLSGSLSISINEESQGWRYVLLVLGIALLLAPIVRKNILSIEVDDVVAHFIKWVIFVIAVTCIFQSSIDTPLATVAVVTCLALCYVISCIRKGFNRIGKEGGNFGLKVYPPF
ncbi:hypothetical protein Tco_0784900, partial [Tanacetum coccineum]